MAGLDVTKVAVLSCDLQEKFGGMSVFGAVLDAANHLQRMCTLLQIPFLMTRQYPKGLGATTPSLTSHADYKNTFDKTSFSMLPAVRMPPPEGVEWTEEEKAATLKNCIPKNVTQIIIIGVETHVCVQQTVFDLMALGYEVFLPVDAIGSQKKYDHDTAIAGMTKLPAVYPTTVDAIMFMMIRDKNHPAFKEVSGMVKAGRTPHPFHTA